MAPVPKTDVPVFIVTQTSLNTRVINGDALVRHAIKATVKIKLKHPSDWFIENDGQGKKTQIHKKRLNRTFSYVVVASVPLLFSLFSQSICVCHFAIQICFSSIDCSS